MTTQSFRLATRVERPAAEVFAWHLRPGAFARLQPPWEWVELPDGHAGVTEGSRVNVRTRLGPIALDWEVEHRDVITGRQFCDVMRRGPFVAWTHTHRFEPAGETASLLVDEVDYRLPAGRVGRLVAGNWVRRKLERLFAYRHAVTKGDLELPAGTGRPQRILLAGGSGLIGSMLGPFLQTQGHEVWRLVRRPPRTPNEIFWHPATGELAARLLVDIDAVVNLAGANVAAGRWNVPRRAAIRDSRVQATRTLAGAFARMARPPPLWINASATGWYGDRGDEELTEGSGPGTGFLAGVCQDWERAAAEPWAGRTVILRFGVVLTPAGGALAKMLPAFRAGVAGRLGSGRQWLSWITPDDLLGAIQAVLRHPEWRGAFNVVAPAPVRNAEFTAALARRVRRPAVLPVPAPALRLLFGAMADETLLASSRVQPRRLLENGFRFRHPDLESGLRHVLGQAGQAGRNGP
ncbi:MAG: TIGR01777 family oxidoreductase [Opitutales bacterium]